MGKKANAKSKTAKKKRKASAKSTPSFLDQAGSGAGKATVEEVKKMLDEMRAEDDD
jgi:hypothetical protein